MPSKKPQVSIRLEHDEYEHLHEWAESEFRTPSALAAIIIKKTLSDRGSSNLSTNELIDQIKKFLALLLGERDRNGISYVLLGQTLGIDPEKLHQLFLLVQECRAEKEKTKQ
ncbi:hypothetical protein WA1_07265 [Scytonema hofmannii PCC 7110]|uniref:CopG-like ribbon-helix-helix domain-containing protein n=1 Tax=Scytonema hofmannii PCC 7110 TaxID=128403 RepID=A0A139WT48_9CYAN|nr:hypothetical protein [Scytonema hofmannii]KYC35612.1 hypothetical protein WA1_07265 [Scytonema hofmannii PCC 7110]